MLTVGKPLPLSQLSRTHHALPGQVGTHSTSQWFCVQVCWHEGSIADLVNSIRRFTPRGSTVTVISKEEPEVTADLGDDT